VKQGAAQQLSLSERATKKYWERKRNEADKELVLQRFVFENKRSWAADTHHFSEVLLCVVVPWWILD
jgi:hypothetical protein